MFILWLLWIIVVFGGLYMGLGSLLTKDSPIELMSRDARM